MGQYWKPVLSTADLREDFAENISGWAYSHDFRQGLKLMEHSYVDNPMVRTIVGRLFDTPQRVVWAGDYADPEAGSADNLYNLADQVHLAPLKIDPTKLRDLDLRWLVNLNRKECVDLTTLPTDPHGFTVDPLCLLTAEGNGRGGGDFMRGGGFEYIGRWARDLITYKTDSEPPAGWTKLRPNFVEE